MNNGQAPTGTHKQRKILSKITESVFILIKSRVSKRIHYFQLRSIILENVSCKYILKFLEL